MGQAYSHWDPVRIWTRMTACVKWCSMKFCHWITNGVETYHERDWGFEVGAELDHREHACQRLQAALADPHGLRDVMAPTGIFRQYYDQFPLIPFKRFQAMMIGKILLSEWPKMPLNALKRRHLLMHCNGLCMPQLKCETSYSHSCLITKRRTLQMSFPVGGL